MKFAILMALLLSGCAMQPKIQAPSGPVTTYNSDVFDESCASLAKYARAVSVMRNIGVKIEDIDFILPKILPVPFDSLKRLVYSNEKNDPATTSQKIYDQCTSAGYKSTIENLSAEEDIYNARVKEIIQQQLKDLDNAKLILDADPGLIEDKK